MGVQCAYEDEDEEDDAPEGTYVDKHRGDGNGLKDPRDAVKMLEAKVGK